MYRQAAIAAIFLQAVLRAIPQTTPPDAAADPIVVKSTSHAVQLDVVVNDPSGHAVHGLQKKDFVVTDNGQPREIRLFDGEIEANQTGPSTSRTVPRAMYSNRLSLRDSPMAMAIVIDAVPRPEGLQQNVPVALRQPRMPDFALARPELSSFYVRGHGMSAIMQMQSGEMMAIYAACPELRIVQDYTADPSRLVASLRAFVPPGLTKGAQSRSEGSDLRRCIY